MHYKMEALHQGNKNIDTATNTDTNADTNIDTRNDTNTALIRNVTSPVVVV